MPQTNRNPKQPPKRKMSLMSWIFLGIAAIFLFNILLPQQRLDKIPYSDFKELLRSGAFQSVELNDRMVVGLLKPEFKEKRDPNSKEQKILNWAGVPDTKSALRPQDDQLLLKALDESKVRYEYKPENTALRDIFISWIFPMILIVALWGFLFRRMGPGTEVMTFGKSKSRLRAESDNKTTFKDVAGQDEAKQELQEVVEFLMSPKKFTSLGGKLPKGILLVGPPGTGKTLLARAVAGEAKVPFFNISGSEFVEMFVGVGAARVRDLFNQAKAKAPCIIFIDELDAIGKARGINPVGGHDEREQTLNQILVEMDGFDTQAGVMIMAATNRPEILDPALLRAGRFDRNVIVGKPNVRERQAILELHAKTVKIGSDVSMETVAKRTPGMVGADLANVVNEAALLAARSNKSFVEMKDFESAVDRILTGLEKKSSVINKREKEIVAHHEAGHAIVSALRASADKVHKITIIPRGIGALGFTLQLPTEDRYLMSKDELLEKVDVLLGGRVAESVIFKSISTGASDDLHRATDVVRSMITKYGMGDTLGPATVEEERSAFLGGGFGSPKNYSEETARQIDEEIKKTMMQRLDLVTKLVRENIALLKEVAQLLLEKETLNADEFQALVDKHKKAPQVALA